MRDEILKATVRFGSHGSLSRLGVLKTALARLQDSYTQLRELYAQVLNAQTDHALTLEMSQAEVQQLSRQLFRLERILITHPDPSLRSSHTKRTALGQTLEQARTLLIELENSPSQESPESRQSTLKEKRTLLQQLQNRLYSLHDQAADDSDSDSDNASDEGLASSSSTEDLLATYAPARHDITSGIEVKSNDAEQQGSRPSNAQIAAAGASLATTLRARQVGSGAAPASNGTSTGTTTGRANAVQEPRLASITPFSPAPTAKEPADTATLLQHHEGEQDALTSSLLTLASALKASTQSFSDSIAASNPLVDQTTTSLEKSKSGLDKASRGMGELRGRRRGWTGGAEGMIAKLRGVLGEYYLWAQIAVLWFVLLVVVFFVPRLRF